MNRVVEILCRRDGITVKEAAHMVNEVREQLHNCIDYDEAEDLLMSELGLEMDYLFDLI